MKPWLVLALFIGVVSGCSLIPARDDPPEARPEDFSLVYKWSEGSLPPPYHYEYSIKVGTDGAGEVRMLPDYEYSNPPEWVEEFRATPAQLDEFYQSARAAGFFSTRWETEEDPPVGGSSESLAVTASGKEYLVPWSVPPDQQEEARALFEAVNRLVPAEIWASLESRRLKYMAKHPDY